ncbi:MULTISPECIES: NAD-dependent epimerase [unclassified Brevundimonas]|uniref:NAD-dependent epimerase n=1 Tax=unclassified Brevundimonas TaxID=2622653 RepID=UPI0025BB5CDE|nr:MULTISPECIES: NAD-dependent epimerase [unclassified Brevundimonas]
MSDPVLVTGSAGFIGFHTAQRLLARGERVVGIDNLNAYYDPALKQARLAQLTAHPNYQHYTLDLADKAAVLAVFETERPCRIVHLGAQAGVRYSLEAPDTYVGSNVTGFLSIIEGARAVGCQHLVYASTSSAYGANGKLPFAPSDGASHPLTLYAATKLANEAMAHAYAHLFGIPMTGLRFFTVYGPWGRPDMALFKFTRAILRDEPIEVYGEGHMSRDFTYVDDIVTGVVAALDQPATVDPAWKPAAPDPSTSGVAPWRILNLGAGQPVPLMRYIEVLEHKLGRKARLNLMPMQDGDVVDTAADVSATLSALGYAPSTPVEEGVGRFVDWYCNFYGEN